MLNYNCSFFQAQIIILRYGCSLYSEFNTDKSFSFFDQWKTTKYHLCVTLKFFSHIISVKSYHPLIYYPTRTYACNSLLLNREKIFSLKKYLQNLLIKCLIGKLLKVFLGLIIEKVKKNSSNDWLSREMFFQ